MTDVLVLTAFSTLTLILALIAGVFLAFSDFIMRSLRAAHVPAGIEAMQEINREVISSAFVFSLIAMVPLTALSALFAATTLDGTSQTLILAGSASYVFGTFGVTILGNVPMNNRLDKMSLNSPDISAYWRIYARDWTRWNHLRTGAAILSAGLYMMATILLVGQGS
ncbi:DUF1772 domain-containing protein [Roseovarius aestuariivivens]|uniref:anthrone oxygenase family protein n=1 Tax=Roseovarius aestuariivivens TaxID=1888910 RepID=UPI00108109E9|nr:anthrone oxygenase family protein [Roseovarius aestuariivivens]